MNGAEAMRLCKFVKAACPSQLFEEETPLAWAMILERERYDDCLAAVIELGGELKYIAPSDVKAKVRRIRAARVIAFGHLPDPPLEVEAAGPAAYQAWLRECQRRIADGEVTSREQLPHRPTGGLAVEPGTMSRTFQAITAGPPITEEERAEAEPEPDVVTGVVVERTCYAPHYDGEACDCAARLAAVKTHTRTEHPSGPAFCAQCSEAVQEWMQWPCPAMAAA